MKFVQTLLAATLLGASGYAAAAPNWVGTADYTAAPTASGDEETVGPFDTYDFARGVVLLEEDANDPTVYWGWYQSYVTNHELSTLGVVTAPGLNTNYEITVTAWFKEEVTGPNTFTLVDGGVKLWFDTTPDRNFDTDTGFKDDVILLEGSIIGGAGALFNLGTKSVGFTDLTVSVDSYNTSVFEPDTIAAGSSIFTLRLNDPSDATFLGQIESVMGHSYDGTDIKLAADGYLVMQVPEAETYAMMLAGLGLVGFMVSRRRSAAAL
ncbi:MAG: flocculation-associated PEP-CTERM protein PepA [Pseudomonadota bacterium]